MEFPFLEQRTYLIIVMLDRNQLLATIQQFKKVLLLKIAK
jgi:hypothetical protein